MDDKGGNVESEKTAVAVAVGEGWEVKWNFLQPLRGRAGRSTAVHIKPGLCAFASAVICFH